jgi:uncharacterized glyoxalase superfamily protein PhnB
MRKMPKKKATKVKPIPKGMRTVTPHLICKEVANAIEFYKKDFSVVEMFRMLNPDGERLLHAEIRVGDSVVMLVDESPEWGALGPTSLKGTPVAFYLYVKNVDAFVARAVKAGAKVVMCPWQICSGATDMAS